MLQVSIISPTFNERENLPKLVEELFTTMENISDIDIELIIVDDIFPTEQGMKQRSLL
ncbi:MAG TPA: hypothetical protein PLE24_07160 [Chitinispirillaceae bacterium]|nr:hypothetical protein [Chitinispirillaceae bacterium]